MEVMEANVCQYCGQGAFVEEKVMEKAMRKALGTNQGVMYILLGWVFVALSIVILPFVFGGAALFMGAMTLFEKSNAHGAILIASALVSTLAGIVFSVVVSGTVFL